MKFMILKCLAVYLILVIVAFFVIMQSAEPYPEGIKEV